MGARRAASWRAGERAADLDDDNKLFDLIEAVYGAAMGADPDDWGRVAGLVSAAIGGPFKISVEDPRTPAAAFVASDGLDAAFRAAYAHHYVGRNPWMQAAVGHPEMAVSFGDEMVEARTLLASEFYNGWLRPQGLRHAVGCMTRLPHGAGVALVAYLPPDRPPTEDDRRLLHRLRPHVMRGLDVHRAAHGHAAARALAEGALDRVPAAVCITDGSARVLFMNRAAEDLVAAADGLTIDARGQLAAALPRQTDALRLAVGQAVATADRQGDTAGTALRLRRPSRRPDLRALVIPSHPHAAYRPAAVDGGSPAPSALLFITAPERAPRPSADRIRDLHDLTAAEARVVAAVAGGASVAETAVRLGIAESTVRQHLKQAFHKTGTRGQPDLVRLILSDPLSLDWRAPPE